MVSYNVRQIWLFYTSWSSSVSNNPTSLYQIFVIVRKYNTIKLSEI